MTPILYFVGPLVVLLYLLIANMHHGRHPAPQAYYRKRHRAANFLLGLPSLVARRRKR